MTNENFREAGSWVFSTIGRVMLFSIKAFLLLLVGLVVWGMYLSWDVDRWDAKIEELCAANGGRDVATKVYETAMAPETKAYFRGLNPLRSFHIPERLNNKPIGPAYPYLIETQVVKVLNDKNPRVVRFTSKVIRVSDGAVLGEQSGYQRSGGGVPGIDPEAIHVCPTLSTKERLDVQVFVNHPEHRK